MSSVIRGGNGKGSATVEIGVGRPPIKFGEPRPPIGFAVNAERGAFPDDPDDPDAFALSRDEIRSFLRLITSSLRVTRHYDLFRLVQDEVQNFIPHRILVSAWGNFDSAELKIDVISAIRGVRTNRPASCDIERLLNTLYVRWLANGRQPLLLHNSLGELLASSSCRCAVHEALHGMRTALVHGNHSVRDGSDSLYLALHTGSITKSEVSVERFRFLADLIISQLDTAFRKVAALKRLGDPGTRSAHRRAGLSVREEEIIDWVARGRTNAEIAGILSLSEFTVKNHVRRIMKKLGAANRTEAVARFRRDVRNPRARDHNEDASVVANRG